MAKKTFVIPGLSEAEQLLEYLMKPEKLKELLAGLAVYEADISAKLDALGVLQDAEAARATAIALMDEARDIRRRADEESAAARTQADTLRTEAQQELSAARAQAATVRQETADRVTALGRREMEVSAQAEANARTGEALARKSVEAEQAMAQARALETEFGSKLARLQAVAVG